jgi:hypothetical protein
VSSGGSGITRRAARRVERLIPGDAGRAAPGDGTAHGDRHQRDELHGDPPDCKRAVWLPMTEQVGKPRGAAQQIFSGDPATLRGREEPAGRWASYDSAAAPSS